MYVRQNEVGENSQALTAHMQQKLMAWNATQQDFPLDVCVPQLVAKQAAATPEAVAIVAGATQMTYRELNQRANQLAHHLQTLGVGPNILVGLCVERSLDMVVGMLAVHKAGGTYVPLDPTSPTERLAFMLEDAHARVLVTWNTIATHLPISNINLVCLDSDWSIIAQQPADEPACAITPDDLAYVIYTSGSTGRPKGVEITHYSLLNLVYWHHHAYNITAADRATQVTSPAFDATGWELWPYLTIGAQVHIVDEETRVSPVLLRDWLVRQGITISFLPTALAESIIGLQWPAQTTLRYLLTGADTLRHYPSPDLPFAFVNNYGPTEATVVATYGRIYPMQSADTLPSIGRPISNTQIYLLDEHLREVPIGTAGELYIGGKGLAKGYLHRPELTAERFITHPFSDKPGERLYKTGDLARFLPDGQIAFMGRADYQIKIRGYRIEPDEIICVLNKHAAIQNCMVIAREDIPGEKRLVAYIVPVPGAEFTATSLREMLGEYLPDYMIPSTFVVMSALPVTANGKVDRAALPVPDSTNTLLDEVVAAPETPAEIRVAHIVTTLLNLESVGIDDNFFMLGGHSLLGTQIIAQIAETFGVELPLRSLFEAPTIRLLASEIEQRIIARLESMSEEEVLRLLAENATSELVN
jgi:amino acid adenylation domain-containing protein